MLYAALVPLLPHFEHRYGLSKSGVGALAAAYAVGVLVGSLPGGIAAARLGTRRAVLGGLALMSAASLGFAFAGSFETLFAARLLQGLGSALTWAGGLAWLRMATPRERRSGRARGGRGGAPVWAPGRARAGARAGGGGGRGRRPAGGPRPGRLTPRAPR